MYSDCINCLANPGVMLRLSTMWRVQHWHPQGANLLNSVWQDFGFYKLKQSSETLCACVREREKERWLADIIRASIGYGWVIHQWAYKSRVKEKVREGQRKEKWNWLFRWLTLGVALTKWLCLSSPNLYKAFLNDRCSLILEGITVNDKRHC